MCLVHILIDAYHLDVAAPAVFMCNPRHLFMKPRGFPHNVYSENSKEQIQREESIFRRGGQHFKALTSTEKKHYPRPIPSMYGIFTYIWWIFVNFCR